MINSYNNINERIIMNKLETLENSLVEVINAVFKNGKRFLMFQNLTLLSSHILTLRNLKIMLHGHFQKFKVKYIDLLTIIQKIRILKIDLLR